MASHRVSSAEYLEKALMSSLFTLGINPFVIEHRRKMRPRSFFHKMDQKTGNEIVHFLFTCIDSTLTTKSFRDCWPILTKKQEAEFRSIAQLWYKDLMKSKEFYPKLCSIIIPSAINPSHPRFMEALVVLVCISFHCQHTGISSKPLLYSPQPTPNNECNTVDILKSSLLYHSQCYIRSLSLARENTEKLKSKSEDMLNYYQKLISDIEKTEKEIGQSLTVNINSDIKALLKEKNDAIETSWKSITESECADKKYHSKISLLTDVSCGGITQISAKEYSIALREINQPGDLSPPFMRDGKLDLSSIIHHSNEFFKELHNKEENENLEECFDSFKNQKKCAESLKEGFREVRNQINEKLPSLIQSVKDLGKEVENHEDSFKSHDGFNFCPPTPHFSLNGFEDQNLTSNFKLLHLTPDCSTIRTTPLTTKIENHKIRRKVFESSVLSSPKVKSSKKICVNEKSSPVKYFEKEIFEDSLISPLESANKFINMSNKYLNKSYGTPGRLSNSLLSTPTTYNSPNDEVKHNEDLGVNMEKVTLIETPKSTCVQSPLVSKLISQIKYNTPQIKEQKKLEIPLQKHFALNVDIFSLENTLHPVAKLSPEKSFFNDFEHSVLTPKVAFKPANITPLEKLSCNISSLESTLGDFNFSTNSNLFEVIQEDQENDIDDETFIDGKLFDDFADIQTNRSKLLPESSVFDTVTDAVLAGDMSTDILGESKFANEIRRESMNKRESLLSIINFRNSLLTLEDTLIGDAEMDLLSDSFDSDL